MKCCLAFDTSNYTTSAALFDGENCHMVSKLLDVPTGALGLRQSEAHFSHTKRLPALVGELVAKAGDYEISCIAASTRPVERERSYMPCFLAGESQARVIAELLKVPFYAFSHQQGHIAAASWSAGVYNIIKEPFLAWHLSGGTTELLYVEPEGELFAARRIGGSSDLSAGQLIDRTGKMLGTAFPAGAAVDALASNADKKLSFTAKMNGLEFSFSGLENKVKDLIATGESPENIAAFAVNSIAKTVLKATKAAFAEYGNLPLLCSGGVARNSTMRRMFAQAAPQTHFAKPEFSSDNAAGVAILGWNAK